MTGEKKGKWPEKRLTTDDSLLKTIEDVRAEAAKITFGSLTIELEIEIHDAQVKLTWWEVKRRRHRRR